MKSAFRFLLQSNVGSGLTRCLFCDINNNDKQI